MGTPSVHDVRWQGPDAGRVPERSAVYWWRQPRRPFNTDIIYRLVRWEAQAAKRDFYEESFNPERGPWCFVDLWPWSWHENLARATELVQWLLQYFTDSANEKAKNYNRKV